VHLGVGGRGRGGVELGNVVDYTVYSAIFFVYHGLIAFVFEFIH
jgi:hypothetical protein